MKIAVVTCYSDPDNRRAQEMRAAVHAMPGMQSIIIKNSRRSWLRYPEILWKLYRINRRRRPEAFILTFRGQEILPLVLRLAGRRPVWFDECVVPINYVNDAERLENDYSKLKTRLARWSISNYRRWLHRCTAVMVESEEQAETSARIAQMNLSSYKILPTPDPEATLPAKSTSRLLAELIADVAS